MHESIEISSHGVSQIFNSMTKVVTEELT